MDRQKSLFRSIFNIKKELSFGSTSNNKGSAVLERAKADNFRGTFSLGSVPQAAKYQVLWEDSELTGVLQVIWSLSLSFSLQRSDRAVVMQAVILRKDVVL